MSARASHLLMTAGLVFASLMLGACGAPSNAVGTIGGRDFNLADAEPELREHGNAGRTVVLADRSVSREDGSDELWLVTLHLPADLRIELGEPIAIGDGDPSLPSLQVAVGEIEVEESANGKVATTTETVYEHAVSGELIVWSLEKVLSADFLATLEKGGEVKGYFEVALED